MALIRETEPIRKDVVVIGAGISGLACAYRLKALGLNVAVIEASNHIGGAITTDNVDGFLIERGPNSTQGTEELLTLVEELGISGDLMEGDPKAPAYVYFGGRLHAVPAGPSALLKSRLLSSLGKLRLFAEPLIPRRSSDQEETVADFARRRIGREPAERLVAPFVSGIYAGDSEKLSVQAAFPRLANLESTYGGLIRGTIAKAREARRARKSASAVLEKAAPARRRLVSFTTGMSFLPRSLAWRLGEDLSIGCSEIVLRKEGSAGRDEQYRYEAEYVRDGRSERLRCKQLVIAATAFGAAGLIEPLSAEIGALLGEIEYPKLAVIHLAYDRASVENSLDGFGFLVAPSEGLNVLGCVWSSSLFAGRAPSGRVLLTTFAGGARNPGITTLPESELVSLVHADLARALGIRSDPEVIAVTRWERAIPQYNLGHATRVRRIEELLKNVPGVRLIGNYLHGVAVGDCVKEADARAREIASQLY
ncbi:MAG TPA: protoporphyrinogen oxidase [Blastocatellia bacterium]|nr:protoporphyrinogen oxidase [Blastocatellia bacterium]